MNKEIERRAFLAAVAASAGGLAYSYLRNPEINEVDTLKKVDFTKNGVMTIEGNRYFPIVLYGLPGDPKKESSWKLARQAGANTVTMFFPTENAFRYAERSGLKTMVRLDYLFPDFEPSAEQLNRVEQKSSVVAWEIDEPYQYGFVYGENQTNPKADKLMSLLSWLSERSELPLRVTTYGPGRRLKYPDSLAFLEKIYHTYPNIISGPDVYLREVEEEITSYVNYWKSNHEAVKTTWQVTSAHSEDVKEFGKELSFDDMLYQTVSGIVAGTRGVGYYDNPWGCRYSCPVPDKYNGVLNSYGKHLKNVRRINELLTKSQPGLLGKNLYQNVSGPIKSRVLIDKDNPIDAYIFCVNTGKKNHNLSLPSYLKGSYIDLAKDSEQQIYITGKSSLSLEPKRAAILAPLSHQVE